MTPDVQRHQPEDDVHPTLEISGRFAVFRLGGESADGNEKEHRLYQEQPIAVVADAFQTIGYLEVDEDVPDRDLCHDHGGEEVGKIEVVPVEETSPLPK